VTAYSFATITDAQALAYNPATDTLTFAAGVTAASISVLFGGGQTFLSVGGRTIAFGAAFTGQTGATFDNGAMLVIGSASADVLTGGAGNDLLAGGDGADVLRGGDGGDNLIGGAGVDTLSGEHGQDTLQGGAGADLFQIQRGDSPADAPDVIKDWSSEDELRYPGTGAYQETSAPDAGRTYANSLIAAGARYVAVQTPAGVIVYIDTASDGGVAEDAVLLSGRTLDDISAANVGAASTLPTAPMGPAETAPPPPPPPTGPPIVHPASYAFDSITAAQALAFDPKLDALSGVFITTRGYSVSFDDAAERITLTDIGAGRSVVFGSAVYDSAFGGGSSLLRLGTPGADYVAASNSPYVFAGAGDDTINIGVGGGAVSGGLGRDVFVAATANAFTHVLDWSPGDRLYLSAQAVTAANYVEGSAASGDAEQAYIKQQFAAGKNYVVVERAGNVTAYYHQDGQADFTYNVLILDGHTLNDISPTDFLTGAAPSDPTVLAPPSAPASTAVVTGSMDGQHLSSLIGLDIAEATSTTLRIQDPVTGAAHGVVVTGSGLSYDANDQITGGLVSHVVYATSGFHFDITGIAVSAVTFERWVLTDATDEAFSTVLAGANRMLGGNNGDVIRGYGGDDIIAGEGVNAFGVDSLFGGLGNDAIYAGREPGDTTPGVLVGATYLRGDEGDDQITGAAGFDDINGNMGNDTAHGGLGDDWVVGGKDQDVLFGDGGNDLVYGNLGADTCDGGGGADTIRGGQGNDTLQGGAGNDFLSGDRGDDTVAGGVGADVFHGSQDAGIDRVIDFNISAGDRVQLDPGTTYALRQDGADTIIDMGGANQMILVGVQMASLPAGWIFGA